MPTWLTDNIISDLKEHTYVKERLKTHYLMRGESGNVIYLLPRKYHERPVPIIGMYSDVYIYDAYRLSDKKVHKVAIKVFKKESEFRYEKAVTGDIRKHPDMGPNSPILPCDHFKFADETLDSLKNRHVLVFEAADYNLHTFNQKNIFTILGVKKIAYDIFSQLAGLHRIRIIHNDIKLENILVKLKGPAEKRTFPSAHIGDFGISRSPEIEDTDGVIPRTVQTVYYRAPEVCRGETPTPAIDVWSVACIIFDLVTKKILFDSGYRVINTDYTISDQSGHHLQHIKRVFKSSFFNPRTQPTDEKIRESLKALLNPKRWWQWSIKEAFPKQDSDNLIDLLARCLVFDPEKRLTAKDALGHDFFDDVRDQGSSTAIN
ncbi:MAG: serine/threonine-protein kinase [Waddliaceae bacterium]|jgi:serine/threonine protein kinase|nr:serine/threonine-protein kinase [Waddliaceae bacterium]MBT3578515.1 serine/threonine-protein kinase [Waddliaceae bacterium]MBT4444897.1 serine/threonine-protein kinase [Waddliaceae bacterium]MBT6928733.1 serine/threonine-protein kinase [Waddliaceae bacterium]MBT7264751.1 serine/threonine-protein kinase [Waddliaceae bacterium]